VARFWNTQRESDDLGDELRRNRPEPSDDFVREMSTRIRPARRQSVRRAGTLRLAPLTGMLALVLVAAGVFGGIAVANGGGGGGDGGDEKEKRGHHTKPDDDQYKGKVVICHKPNSDNPRTMRVREHKVEKFLARGDTLGPCEAADAPVDET
jgi:hypothetical protein